MSANKRINILVYTGSGAAPNSVRHATDCLRNLVGTNYAVLPITSEQFLKEPWTASCALLVMPGGADMGYCRVLNGEGNRRIKNYVSMGGAYLGLCAGGYYGSEKCEFEVGKVKEGMEVVGDRELSFFPGTCRGLAFPGFVYHSEAGTRAAELKINKSAFPSNVAGSLEDFRSYYNGGGVFVDAEKWVGKHVEILASYGGELAVESGKGKAAVVYCKNGDGNVILTGPHPEFSGGSIGTTDPANPNLPSIVSALTTDEKKRSSFMGACLSKLGLTVSEETQALPQLSALHLCSSTPSAVTKLLRSWQDEKLISRDGEHEVIVGENDTFQLTKGSTFDMEAIARAIKEANSTQDDASATPDYNVQTKHLMAHEETPPSIAGPPPFSHSAFFSSLSEYDTKTTSPHAFGKILLYGETVTSTSTLLEKNPTLLATLPTGTTATATRQVAGRGRGANVWVSPPGSLMFSTVMRHSMALSQTAPVVFIQYIAALAISAGIRNYDTGYERLPIRLKWPNDIYALGPTKSPRLKSDNIAASKRDDYVKIGGILVNSSYSGGDYTLIPGIGLNVLNSSPTTSLATLCEHYNLPPPTLEKLLASILSQFEMLYTDFCRSGFDERFRELYYKAWLHGEQIVTLEQEGGVRARIKGITKDWGLLVAEELGWEDRPTGRTWELQSDSNSFDFFKGLLKRKV
ncbi:hypothetical protein MBLNU230_g4221t1 [Neophaeotheca triangularis]